MSHKSLSISGGGTNAQPSASLILWCHDCACSGTASQSSLGRSRNHVGDCSIYWNISPISGSGGDQKPLGRSTSLPHGTFHDQKFDITMWNEVTKRYKEAEPLARPQLRSPMPCLGSSDGAIEVAQASPGWHGARVHGHGKPGAGETWSFSSSWACWYPSGTGHCRRLQPEAGWTPLQAPVCPGDGAPSLRAWGSQNGLSDCPQLSQVTRLTGKKPRDVIRAGRVAQKPSLPADWPVGLQEQKLHSGVGISYLYQPGELEGGCRCATDPVWSLEVYQLGGSVTKQAEHVVYYL